MAQLDQRPRLREALADTFGTLHLLTGVLRAIEKLRANAAAAL